MANIRELRTLYEERARASNAERDHLMEQLRTNAADLDLQAKKWVQLSRRFRYLIECLIIHDEQITHSACKVQIPIRLQSIHLHGQPLSLSLVVLTFFTYVYGIWWHSRVHAGDPSSVFILSYKSFMERYNINKMHKRETMSTWLEFRPKCQRIKNLFIENFEET